MAKIICWIEIGASVICGISVMALGSGNRYYNDFSSGLKGLLIIVIGSLVAWIGSFFTYGFGQLIEDTSELRRIISEKSSNSNNSEPVYTGVVNAVDSNSAKPQTEVEGEITVEEKKSENPAWIDIGNQKVRCPGCGREMTVDFIHARKKCPECGCQYRQ